MEGPELYTGSGTSLLHCRTVMITVEVTLSGKPPYIRNYQGSGTSMVHCHRNILAAQSPVFSQLLQQMGPPNPTSKGGKVIPLLSVPSSVAMSVTFTHAHTHTHTRTCTLGEHSSGVRPRCIQRCAHLHVLGAPDAAPRFCLHTITTIITIIV